MVVRHYCGLPCNTLCAVLQAFERLLFRATRGNMYLRHATVGTVVDPITGDKQEKAVFVVFFAGERARTKILKVRPACCRRCKQVHSCLHPAALLVSTTAPAAQGFFTQ